MDRLAVPFLIFIAALAEAQYSQSYQSTTPVPILKQIDRHNEDGSYSYGYEAADGSFKIESKYPTGEVYGKYGFVDDTGKVRQIEYGASQRGFEPAGTDINVPPSIAQGNNIAGPNDPEDDGQYREDPSIYHTDPKYTNGEYYRPVSKRPNRPIQSTYNEIPAAYNPAPQRINPHSAYNPAPTPAPIRSQYQPAYQSQYQQDYRSEDGQFQYQDTRQYPSGRSYQRAQPQIRQDYNLGSYENDYTQ